MRWKQALPFTILKPPCQLILASDQGLQFAMDLQLAESSLTIDFKLQGRDPAPDVEYLEWWARDHAVFFFDVGHDHMTEHMYIVRRDGQSLEEIRIKLPGEETIERLAKPTEAAMPVSFEYETFDEGEIWGGSLRVDLKAAPGPVIGFAAKGVSGCNPIGAAVYPESIDPMFRDTPLEYADMYIGETSAIVDRLSFGRPEWLRNTGEIVVQGGEGLSISTVFTCYDVRTETAGELSGNESAFSYECDFRGKWASDVCETARLRIELKNDSGAVWQGTFPFGFDCGIIARDVTGKGKRKKPAPDDSRFAHAYREYLLDQLPDFKRAGTKQGAPSDYCLISEQMGQTWNLLDEDIFAQLAQMVYDRFPDSWMDGLCAASAFLGSAYGIRHSAKNAGLAGAFSPEGLLQLSAGFCGQENTAFDRLADGLAPLYKMKWESFTIGLRGHIAAALLIDGDYYIFDAMLGIFFLTHDNKQFATLEELRKDRDLTHCMDASCRAHGHEFYYGIEHHVISRADYSGRSIVG